MGFRGWGDFEMKISRHTLRADAEKTAASWQDWNVFIGFVSCKSLAECLRGICQRTVWCCGGRRLRAITVRLRIFVGRKGGSEEEGEGEDQEEEGEEGVVVEGFIGSI